MRNIINLTGKKIIVTGASMGIGCEVAKLLSQVGAQVVLVARNEEKLKETLSQLEKGANHFYKCCDLSEIDTIGKLIKDIIDYDEVKLDGFVHCAGLSKMLPLGTINYAIEDQMMRINYYAFIELTKEYSKKKNNNGGSIVGISSTAAANGEMCQTVYTATKGALDAVLRPLSKELVRKGIRINSVRPGLTQTDMGDELSMLTGKDIDAELASTQVQGMVQPIDVANAVAFLLSDASRFITGRSIFVDGGRPS